MAAAGLRLVVLAREHYRPVMGDDGRAYAVATSAPPLACPVLGDGPAGLRSRLAALYYEATGRAPSGRSLGAAVATWACEAERTGPVPVAYRVARAVRAVVVDLGRPDGRCVACTVPGRGDPGAPFPCGPVTLARAALRVIESQPAVQSGSWTSTDTTPLGEKDDHG